MLHTLIQFHYLTFIIILFMMIFIKTNHVFGQAVVQQFQWSLKTVFVLVLLDGVEYYTATLATPTFWRLLAAVMGYSIRPVIIYTIALLLGRQKYKRSRNVLQAIPLMYNTIVACSAFFTEAVFSYSETNEFVMGPLGYTSYIVSAYYLLVLLVETVYAYRDKNIEEATIVFAIILASTLATVLEFAKGFTGLFNGTAAIAITYYYFFLYTQQFKLDALTKALNRSCYEMDSKNRFDQLTAVVVLDMNNLKYINDNLGHAEGDQAICTMADCVRKSLRKGCRLYRTGGDEFMILSFRGDTDKDTESIQKMVEDIRQGMAKTPYSCAIGVAYKGAGNQFDQLCDLADKIMYADKKKMKEGQHHKETR